jgi:hypothetical protein
MEYAAIPERGIGDTLLLTLERGQKSFDKKVLTSGYLVVHPVEG